MHNTEIQELREQLNDFIQAIQNVNENDIEQHQHIHNQYRALYYVYAQLSEQDIHINFEENEIKLIQYFHLGMEYENQFNELLSHVQTDLQSTLAFIGSNKGFHLLNNNQEFDKYTEDELRVFFGSLFGIQLSQECVKSLRAEKLSSILGYALSGRFEQLKPSLQGLTDIEKSNAIRNDIQRFDLSLSYKYDEVNNGIEVDAQFEVQNKNRSRNRGRNRADNCFINELTKTIHIGCATSNLDAKAQGYSFFKSFSAVQALVDIAVFEDGQKNPFHGYRIQPYMLLNTRFSLDNSEYQAGSSFREMLGQANYAELRLINQLPWFRMVSNCANQEHLHALIEHDIYMTGCDTSNIHAALGMIKNKPKEQQILALRDMVLSSLNIITSAVNKNSIDLSHGNAIRTLQMLNDITDTAKNILQKSKTPVDEAYHQEYLVPLRASLLDLVNQLDASGQHNQSKTDILTKIVSLSDDLESPVFCNRMIAQDRSKELTSIKYVGNNGRYILDVEAYQRSINQEKNNLKNLILDEAAIALTDVFPRRGKNIINYYKDYLVHYSQTAHNNLYNNLSTAMDNLGKRGYSNNAPYVQILQQLRDSMIYQIDVYEKLIALDYSDTIKNKMKEIRSMEKEMNQFHL